MRNRTILALSVVAALSSTASAQGQSLDLVFDEHGNVIEGDDESVTIEWQGPLEPVDVPEDTLRACPEVNDPPTYKLTKSRRFIVDKKNPFSSWLLPGQTVTYTTESAHEFGVSITVGTSAEAGAFLAKASAKLDIQAGYKYTAKAGRTISDRNSTSEAYRARLGNLGYRIIETKTYVAPPCKVKTVTTHDMVAPEVGDLSFGRFKS
jgi:hypothetical protein